MKVMDNANNSIEPVTSLTSDEIPRKHKASITLEDTDFFLDSELMNGLFSFKDLLARKLIPANFAKTSNNNSKQNNQNQEEYNLQLARSKCPPSWGRNLKNVAFTEMEIQTKVQEMASKISRDYDGKEIVAVGLLTGAICFMTDLLKCLKVPYSVDFIACSSYGKGTESKGSPVMMKDMSSDPAGKHILLIEDIIDTGRTLAWLKGYLSGKNCASVRVACLLDKKARRTEKQVHIDYKGFDCPDDFVVGYGMDFAGHYRCLPFIGVLKPEAYA